MPPLRPRSGSNRCNSLAFFDNARLLLMKPLLVLSCFTALAFSQMGGCATTQLAATPLGAAVIAKTSNSVIDKGLNAGATKIDNGNPYLHALADGLRANEGKILTSEDVQKLAADYGDPANQHKFKSLALDVLNVIKGAAINIGWSAATELAAKGLQQGADSMDSK